MDWRKKLEEIMYGHKYPNRIKKVQAFIETEIIEKLIKEIPDGNQVSGQTNREYLKAKWLTPPNPQEEGRVK